MRPAPRLAVSAPSSSLLRFLKSQSEEICFFTPSRAPTCQDHRARRNWRTRLNARLGPPESTRCLTTTCVRRANVESSIFNLDTLLPHSKRLRTAISALHYDQAEEKSGISASKAVRTLRSVSTESRPLLQRLWKQRERKEKTDLKPTDIPPLPSFLDDVGGTSLGRKKSGKAANDLKLRCTEFDNEGKVTLMDGEFKKTELIAKVRSTWLITPTIDVKWPCQMLMRYQYGLLPRDLRKIDSSLLPHILVRPSAILINLLHLRVLIKHNCVLVLDAYGTSDSYTQSQFMYDLQGKLGQKEASRQAGGLPYEFRALEAVLVSVTTGLEGEFEGVSQPVMRVLQELEEDIDRDKLRHLLIYSKKLGTFEQKARLVRDAIDDLLEADDDLVAMYLTERALGKVREEDDHTEVEMLLESYHKVCDEIVQVASNLVSNIRNTEEVWVCSAISQ